MGRISEREMSKTKKSIKKQENFVRNKTNIAELICKRVTDVKLFCQICMHEKPYPWQYNLFSFWVCVK